MTHTAMAAAFIKAGVADPADEMQPVVTAARVILADVERHGGEDAGIVRWARAFMARLDLI